MIYIFNALISIQKKKHFIHEFFSSKQTKFFNFKFYVQYINKSKDMF